MSNHIILLGHKNRLHYEFEPIEEDICRALHCKSAELAIRRVYRTYNFETLILDCIGSGELPLLIVSDGMSHEKDENNETITVSYDPLETFLANMRDRFAHGPGTELITRQLVTLGKNGSLVPIGHYPKAGEDLSYDEIVDKMRQIPVVSLPGFRWQFRRQIAKHRNRFTKFIPSENE